MKAPAEAGEVLRPDIGAGMAGEAFAMHQDHRLAGTRLVVAGAHAGNVDELGLEGGDGAILRGGGGRRGRRQGGGRAQSPAREATQARPATGRRVAGGGGGPT